MVSNPRVSLPRLDVSAFKSPISSFKSPTSCLACFNPFSNALNALVPCKPCFFISANWAFIICMFAVASLSCFLRLSIPPANDFVAISLAFISFSNFLNALVPGVNVANFFFAKSMALPMSLNSFSTTLVSLAFFKLA